MVQIKIKGINRTYHVVAQYDDAQQFFITLEERLKRCLVSQDGYFEAFFHVTFKDYSDLVSLFRVCKECHTIVLGIHHEVIHKQTCFFEGNMRGGERYRFDVPMVVLGHIESNAYVECSESLYVVGKVRGNIDLLHEDNTLYASYLHANVRICDTSYQNMTSFSACKVYYNNRSIEIEHYKEELQWEKLSPLRLEKAV